MLHTTEKESTTITHINIDELKSNVEERKSS